MANLELTIKQEQGILTLENKQALIELTKEMVTKYQNLVVTDDEEVVKGIKKQRAEVSKLSQTIDAKRKEVKKEFEKPLKTFEKDMKEIKEIADNVIADIDIKLKEVNDKRIAEKTEVIKGLIEEHSQGYPVEIRKDWLNKTYKEKDIVDDIKMVVYEENQKVKIFKKQVEQINEASKVNELTSDGYIQMLKNGFDVADILVAINSAGAEKRKEEEEKQVETPAVEVHPAPETIKESEKEELISRVIKVTGTRKRLHAMNQFCLENGIEVTLI